MDLAAGYRALVRRHFPQARIVADRFHVIRTVNHHFLACWKQIDPVGARHRGLVSLMRRHRHNLSPEQHQRLAAYLRERPALEAIYRFQTAAVLCPAGKGPEPKTLSTAGASLLARHRRAPLLRVRATGATRPYSAHLARGDRHHVALHPQQRNHRRLPHQNGSLAAPGVRLPKLPKL